MGAGSSTCFSSLPTNDLLKKLVGPDVITYNDPYWNTLLSFASRVPRTSGDSRLLDESIMPLFHELVSNCPLSGNLATLITVFLARAVELKESARCQNSVFVWQAHNALFILRVVSKLLLEHHTEHKALQLLQCTISDSSSPASVKSSSSDGGELVSRLLECVVTVITELPVTAATYTLHLEAVTTLTVLLSGHVCVHRTTDNHEADYRIFRLLQESCGPEGSRRVVQCLVERIISRAAPPPDPDSSSSFVAGLAAGLWSMLTLGLAPSTDGTDGSESNSNCPAPAAPVPPSPLADQSLLLLLVLVTHSPDAHNNTNAFGLALFAANNAAGDTVVSLDNNGVSSTAPAAVGSSSRVDSSSSAGVSIPYPGLYSALTLTLHTEQATLLLYLVMHNNHSFRSYLLSLSELEVVVLPLLQTLHFAPKLSSHHVYMALIVLLMLSEDAAFNAALHDIPVSAVPWYCERPLYNISLGDLLILVLIRTITFNMTKMRDRYLHSNCLAALANMSSQFRSIHPYVCQRLLGLLETLSKRHTRITQAIRDKGATSNGAIAGLTSSTDSHEEELLSDLGVIEEVLRMVLEILNSTLTHQLCHNSQLLYSLLYKRHVFLPFSTQPNFSDVCQNIDVVLNYLMNKLEKTTTDPSVSDVQQVIEQGVLQLPKDRLRKFPELKFKYVEESSPEEFFIPYVWTLVYQSSGLYWTPDNVALFDPSGQET